MRTFIAIPVPEQVKQYANRIKNDLGSVLTDVKWVEFANYHLTLKFLGDINKNMLEDIKQRLITVGESCPRFELSAKQLGYFPNNKRPRVIWLGVEGELEKAQFLGERVDAYLSQLGFEPEDRRNFHLTLGRIRSEQDQDKLMQKTVSINSSLEKIIFAVDAFYFMESQLSSSGPRYIPLARIDLNG
ncbi:MAG: RNA 2',3'-cyclic phosphodiesterase [Syntrophomonadaceae bacterium]|nr:RNA 2',3'-cyclic phosphodiesterase [Syntrophomonadaceae bacterium]